MVQYSSMHTSLSMRRRERSRTDEKAWPARIVKLATPCQKPTSNGCSDMDTSA